MNGLLLMLSGLKFAACMALVSAICCFGLYRFGKEIKALRIFTGVLAGILVALLLIVMPFSLIFGQFGKTTVLERMPSPDGRHVAFVVDSDEGALGGSTVVRVEKTSLPFRMAKPFFSVRKNVFIGDWGIGDELSVEWLGESVLLVDDKQYGF